MHITNDNKILAQKILETFRGKPRVFRYWDDYKKSYIDIVSSENRPYKGIISFSTVGLSDYTIGLNSEEVPLRIELVGACSCKFSIFSNILASCAINIINLNYSCRLGIIFENIIEQYLPTTDMKHILFVSPFVWENKLEIIIFNDKKVAWLQAIPISDSELLYAKQNGSEALETLFEKKQIDIFNLMRDSIL